MKIRNITDDDVATLKAARKILRKLTKQYNTAWRKAVYAVPGEPRIAIQSEIDIWTADLYRKANVDFLEDKAFIALD